MDALLTLGYAAVYFSGCYGADVLNRAMRRIVIGNVRLAGLALLGIVAVLVSLFIWTSAPATSTAGALGHVRGRLVVGPVLIVVAIVGVRMWLDNRRHEKSPKVVK